MVPTKNNTILIMKLIQAKNTLSNLQLLPLITIISLLDLCGKTKSIHNTCFQEQADSFSKDSLASLLHKTALKYFKVASFVTKSPLEIVLK